MKPLFQGSMVALITPFDRGKIDEKSLRALIDWQIENGTDCLVPCGTTGEAPTLSYEEHERIVAVTVEQAAGRVPVIAGAGSNATDNAIRLTKQAKRAGAQATLQVTPYYNKPTQEGLFQHFQAIAKAVDLPMILYNVPTRTSLNMEIATTLRLSQIDIVVGIKEACGKLEQIHAIIQKVRPDFGVYSGDDPLNMQVYALGGKGTISVTANIAPQRVAKVWNAHNAADRKTATLEQERLQPLNQILFIETNPIPVKTALAMTGRCKEEFRLPLCPMQETNRSKLGEVLRQEKIVL